MANKKDQFYDFYDDIEKNFNQINGPDLEDEDKDSEKIENDKSELSQNENSELDEESKDENIESDKTSVDVSDGEKSSEEELEKEDEDGEEVEGVKDRDDIYTHMKNKPSVDDDEPVRQIEGKTKMSKGSKVSDDLLLDKEDRAKKPDEEIDMTAQVEAAEEEKALREEERKKYRKYREKELRHRQINSNLYKDAEKTKKAYEDFSLQGESESAGIELKKPVSEDSFELERSLDGPKIAKSTEKNDNQSKDDKEKKKNAEKFSDQFTNLNKNLNFNKKNVSRRVSKQNTIDYPSNSNSYSSQQIDERQMFYNNAISNDGVLLKNIPNNDVKPPINSKGEMFLQNKERMYDKGFTTNISDSVRVKSDLGVRKNASVYDVKAPSESKKESDANDFTQNFKPRRLAQPKRIKPRINTVPYKAIGSAGMVSKKYIENSFNNNLFAMAGTSFSKVKDDYKLNSKLGTDYFSIDEVSKRAKRFESEGIVNDTVRQSRKFNKLKGDLYVKSEDGVFKNNGGRSSTFSVKNNKSPRGGSSISVRGNSQLQGSNFANLQNSLQKNTRFRNVQNINANSMIPASKAGSRAKVANNFYSNAISARYASKSMKVDPYSSLSNSPGYEKSSYRNGNKNYSHQIGYSYKGIGSNAHKQNNVSSPDMKNIKNDSIKNARLYAKLKGNNFYAMNSPFGSLMQNGGNGDYLNSKKAVKAGMIVGRGPSVSYAMDDLLKNELYNSQISSKSRNIDSVKATKGSASRKFAEMQDSFNNKRSNMRVSGKGVYDIYSTDSIVEKTSLSSSSGLVSNEYSKNNGSKLVADKSAKDPRYHKEESRQAVSNDRGKISIVRKENAAGIISDNDKLSGVKASQRKQAELLKKNRELKAGKARYKASLFGKSIEEQLEDFEGVKKSHEYMKNKDGAIRLGKNSAFENDDVDIFGNSKEKLDEFGNPIVDDGMKSIPGFRGRVGNKSDFLGQKTVNASIGRNAKMRVGNFGPRAGKMKSIGLTKGNAIINNFLSKTGKTYGKKYDNPGATFMAMPQMPKIKSPGMSIGKGFTGFLGGVVAIGGAYQGGRYYGNTLLQQHEINWHAVQADVREKPGNKESRFYTEVAKIMFMARHKCYYELMMGRDPDPELKKKAKTNIVDLVELKNKHIRDVTLDGNKYSKEDLEFDNVKEWTENNLAKQVGKKIVLVSKDARYRYVDEDWRTLIGEDKFILQSNSDIVFPDGTGGPGAPASFFDGSSGGGSLSSLRGADNAQKIWNALKDLGYSNAGIAGIMGNLMLESGLDPDIQEIGHSRQGYGLAQWTTQDRKAKLKAFANSKGVSVSDLQMQVEFIDFELKRNLPSLYNYLQSTNDYMGATDRFMYEYEIPGVPNRAQRQSFASEIWGKSRSLELDKDDGGDQSELVGSLDRRTSATSPLDSIKNFLFPIAYADPVMDADDPNSETNRYADGIERAEQRKREDKKYKVNGDEKVMTINDGRRQKFIYTPWRAITRQGSDQLRLKQKGESYTSDGYGVIDGRFAVAVTPEYGKIGDKIDAYLEDGTKIPSIIVDIKNPADDTYEPVGHELADGTLNVLEFYTNWEGRHSNPGEPGSGNRMEWSGKGVSKIVNLNDNYLGNVPGGSDGMEFGNEGANAGGTGADGIGNDSVLPASISMSDDEKAGQILFLREMLGMGSIGGFYNLPDVLTPYLKYILDQMDFAMTGDDAKVTPNIDFEYITINETFDRYEDDGDGNLVFKEGKKYVELKIKNSVQSNLSYLEEHEKNFNKWDRFSRKYGDKIPQSYIALNSRDFEEIFNITLEPQGYASSSNYITAGFSGAIDFKEVTGIPYLDFAITVANDDTHGYSQGPARDSLVDFDCSSLVYYSLQQTMFPQLPRGAFTTHNMGSKLMELGFQRFPGNSGFQVGDILVNSQTHTEMVVGIAASGRPITVGAKSAEGGGIFGQTGDQTGSEITVAENYSSWESIYRPPAPMMKAMEQQRKEAERKEKVKKERDKKQKKKAKEID